MNVAVADSNCKDWPPFTLPELLVFLGLLIHASRFPFCTHEEVWGVKEYLKPSGFLLVHIPERHVGDKIPAIETVFQMPHRYVDGGDAC
jgi:hypothetical protein